MTSPFTTTGSGSVNRNNTAKSVNEPSSVLDLRRSSSPVGCGPGSIPEIPAVSAVLSDDPSFQWFEHALRHPRLLTSDDWNTMAWVLGGKDDSTHTVKNPLQSSPHEPQNPNHPHFPPSDPFVLPDLNLRNDFSRLQSSGGGVSNQEFDCSQLDQLIRAVGSFESSQFELTQDILERINQRLQSPAGKPLQRATFHFKEALQLLLLGSNSNPTARLSSSEMAQKIRAHKTFNEISPIAPFANFTANQALIEALDGALFIHIVDFEIGLGGQWSSFMQEMVDKARSRNVAPSNLRVTAVVTEESSMETNLVKDNLQKFAMELGIRFQFEFVLVRSFEILYFNAIRFFDGELIAIKLSPTIFQHLRSSSAITEFLRNLQRISPQITVFVDAHGWRDAGAPSFRRSFINGLKFYSAILESLDAADTSEADAVRKIERFLLRPKIVATVAAAGNGILQWQELFTSSGMLPVPFSEFADSQAEGLARSAQVRGFHVAKREGMMILYWQEREFVATSVWRCQAGS